VCTCLLFVVDCFNKKSVVASISVSAHWDVAATVCRSIWIPTQCGVGIEDVKKTTTLSLFNLNERTKK
jgi:hypothetical protein